MRKNNETVLLLTNLNISGYQMLMPATTDAGPHAVTVTGPAESLLKYIKPPSIRPAEYCTSDIFIFADLVCKRELGHTLLLLYCFVIYAAAVVEKSSLPSAAQQ